ncbi:sensor histidine kinase [Marinobacteraceae bacterium S3BR75-40.1]
MAENEGPITADSLFIPDLCRVRAVFLLLITTELVALLFALVRGGSNWLDWDFLGLVSLLMQWTVLTSAALICLLRPWLARFNPAQVTIAVLLLVLADVGLFTYLADTLILGQGTRQSLDPVQWGRNLLIAALVTLLVLRYFYLQHQWQAQRQSSLQAKIAALQARIQPHFLFNSLNSIASLIASDPDKAEDAVLDLSEIFRASLRNDDELITLDQELHLCRQYLAVETLRLGERLQVEWLLDASAGDQALPPLTLQPLVENAVYHGIQPFPEGGTLQIETQLNRNSVYVLVRNPLPRAETRHHHGNRIALENIRARLAALFGDQAVLKSSYHEGWYTVTLRLPRKPLREVS